MPRLKHKFPKLCRHHKGQAFVKIDGQTVWLGAYGDDETREAYDRLIAEWLSNGRKLPTPEPVTAVETTVSVLVNEYRKHLERTNAKQQYKTKLAMRALRKLYGSLPACQFTPPKLETVRDTWVRDRLARATCNERAQFIVRMFRWASARGMVPVGVWQALTAIEPLKHGQAKDGRRVKPAPRSHIRQVRRQVPRQVRALTTLQLLTGARSGELLKLRPVDISTKGTVWTAKLDQHKTAHHRKARTLYFGPRAQRVLAEFMTTGRPTDAFLFSPREANAEGKRKNAKGSRRPDQKPNPTKTDRTIGQHYTSASYRRAVERGCKSAGVPYWHPHQLRHNAATVIRREYGIEVAQLLLGHAVGSQITELYAEEHVGKLMKILEKVG